MSDKTTIFHCGKRKLDLCLSIDSTLRRKNKGLLLVLVHLAIQAAQLMCNNDFGCDKRH